MSEAQRKPVATIGEWVSFDEAYEAFSQANPMLGLSSATWATINLRRNFGAQLVAMGAVVHLPNKSWIAHREKFGPALFELLVTARDEILQKARDRQAEQAAGRS